MSFSRERQKLEVGAPHRPSMQASAEKLRSAHTAVDFCVAARGRMGREREVKAVADPAKRRAMLELWRADAALRAAVASQWVREEADSLSCRLSPEPSLAEGLVDVVPAPLSGFSWQSRGESTANGARGPAFQ